MAQRNSSGPYTKNDYRGTLAEVNILTTRWTTCLLIIIAFQLLPSCVLAKTSVKAFKKNCGYRYEIDLRLFNAASKKRPTALSYQMITSCRVRRTWMTWLTSPMLSHLLLQSVVINRRNFLKTQEKPTIHSTKEHRSWTKWIGTGSPDNHQHYAAKYSAIKKVDHLKIFNESLIFYFSVL